MNRLSWDSTAPRRPTGKHTSPSRRLETEFQQEADLIRVAWTTPPHRVGPF